MTYDSASLDLADHFLADEPALANRREELAIAIQRAVEDWIDAARDPNLADLPEGT